MDRRIIIGLTILFFLQSCTSTPTQFPVSATSNGPIASPAPPSVTGVLEVPVKTSTPMAEPTTTPLPTTTSKISTMVTVTITPSFIETEFPEPTVIHHQVVEPTTPLDPKSYRSVLDWIKFSFANRDLSVVEDLASKTILFGISEAEYTDVLTKDELIKNLTMHLAKGTQCLAYTFREGEINSLDVFMANWEPNWEYHGRNTNDLIFHFSDQGTPDSGLSLVGVEVPHAIDQYYVSDLFEHMCFE